MAGSRVTSGRSSSETAASTAAISSASGGSGDELLGAGADGVRRAPRIPAHAAGHHRHPDALGLVGGDQGGDVQVVVHQQQVRPLPGPQRMRRLRLGLHVGDLGAGVHRHLHRQRELGRSTVRPPEAAWFSSFQRGVVRRGRAPSQRLVPVLDDLGHGHAEPLVHHHHLAAGDQAVVDVRCRWPRRPCGPAPARYRRRASGAGRRTCAPCRARPRC